MADILALPKLYADVVARFALDGTLVAQPFGWRSPFEQTDAARIAWVPGDPRGNAGVVGPAKYPGQLPRRSLATFFERFHVIISTYDETDPENELAQYSATRLLRDVWHRAVYLAAHGTFTIDSTNWYGERIERRLGAALLVVCTIESTVPDEALESMPLEGARAVIQVSELDVTETLTVEAEGTP